MDESVNPNREQVTTISAKRRAMPVNARAAQGQNWRISTVSRSASCFPLSTSFPTRFSRNLPV
jgi:hypothetical protein